jgi:hypothetical protein
MTSFEENNCDVQEENLNSNGNLLSDSEHENHSEVSSPTFKPLDPALILDLLNTITTDSLQLQIKINLHVSFSL